MRTVYCFHSKGWFSCHQVIFLNVLRVFVVKSMQHFKWKDAISGFLFHPASDRFRRNLSRWCSSTLLTRPTVNNLKFYKSKMASAAILKKSKNRHILATVWLIATKFDTVTQFEHLHPGTLWGCSYAHIGCFCGSGRHLMLLIPLIRKLTYRSWARFSKLPKIILRFA